MYMFEENGVRTEQTKTLPTPPPLDITKGDGCHSHSQVAGAYIFIRREYASRIKVR